MSSAGVSSGKAALADTNVVISSFLHRRSVSFSAIEHLGKRYSLLVSPKTLLELEAVILRAKFDVYLPLRSRLALFSTYRRSALLLEPEEHIRACRDPRDDKFLELAVSGGADLILSGDADLLALHPFCGVAILTPAAYLASAAAQ